MGGIRQSFFTFSQIIPLTQTPESHLTYHNYLYTTLIVINSLILYHHNFVISTLNTVTL